MWLLTVPDSNTAEVNDQIGELLSKVASGQDAWRTVREFAKVELFCGFFMDTTNQGFGLSAEILAALSHRGIALGFDVYAPTQEEYDELGKSNSAQSERET